MAVNYEAGEKFLRVIQLFQRLSDTERGLTTAQLAEELEVTPRSVQRYIRTLRDSVGIDIEEQSGKWRIGRTSKLPPMQLDHFQATALLIAVRLLHQMNLEQDPALIGAVAQLARSLSNPVVTRYLQGAIQAAEARPLKPERRQVEKILVEGFVKRQAVEVEYQDKKGDTTKRVLHPYFLEPRFESRTIYVFAFDERSKEVRTLRLDRMLKARLLLSLFQVPEDFDIDDVVSGSWGIWQGEPTVQVVLRFDPQVTRRVKATPWHVGATFEELDNGGTMMRVSITSEVEMRPWVLGWGAAVEVLQPPSLRQYVADAMKAGAALYQ